MSWLMIQEKDPGIRSSLIYIQISVSEELVSYATNYLKRNLPWEAIDKIPITCMEKKDSLSHNQVPATGS
jgi:hypothetical protein